MVTYANQIHFFMCVYSHFSVHFLSYNLPFFLAREGMTFKLGKGNNNCEALSGLRNE